MSLEKVSRGRDNNLDIIRFTAAILVILCHAFPIMGGEGIPDPLSKLTDDQLSFGSLAVGIFFVYGGFLICKSVCRLKTAKAYFKARILRIFPALMAVTFVLVFIVGAILTELPIKNYYTDISTYKYLLNGFLIGILLSMHNLPGVFTKNIYGQAVNGPLWTLPIEFLCYIMCFILYKIKFMDKKNTAFITVVFIAGCIGAHILSGRIVMLSPMIRPIGLFFTGILYYVYRDKVELYFSLYLISLAGMVLSIWLGIFPYTVFLFFPYFFMYLGYGTKRKFSHFSKYGEISYGMYLCAWPVQQILAQLSDNKMNPYINFMITVPISVILGFLCCKLIDEPVMNIQKRKDSNR